MTDLQNTTTSPLAYSECCTLADCSHKTNNKEQKIKNVKRVEIGLIDVDGFHFPNLALMKISAFYKKQGYNVEWCFNFKHYDKVFMSKVFTFTPDYYQSVLADEIIKGGSGYDYETLLPKEIDDICPDYSLYSKYKEAYGFLTRGCTNKCAWCLVPKKEGNISAYQDIEQFLDGRRTAILMDNNVLAHKHGLQQIEKIIRLGIKVDFNQGLDCRIIANNEHIAELLAKVKWLTPLRMACDTVSQMPYIEKAAYLLRKHNIKPKRLFAYVLVKEIPDALERLQLLRSLDIFPFAMAFRDFDKNGYRKQEIIKFCSNINHNCKSSNNKIDVSYLLPKY